MAENSDRPGKKQEQRWQKTLVSLGFGARHDEYTVVPKRGADLWDNEYRAWTMSRPAREDEDSGPVTYRQAVVVNGENQIEVTCDCPAGMHGKPCKHADWLKWQGFAPTDEEVGELIKAECEVAALEARCERLHEDLQGHDKRAAQEIQNLTQRLNNLIEKAERDASLTQELTDRLESAEAEIEQLVKERDEALTKAQPAARRRKKVA